MKEITVTQLLDRVFDEVEYSVSFVFQGGEPLLAGLDFYRNFAREVQSRTHRQIIIKYSIQTNGLLLDNDFMDWFQKESWLIGISLDGNAATHDAFRTDAIGSATHTIVTKRIKEMNRRGMDYVVSSVVHRQNIDAIAATYHALKELGVEWMQFIPYVDVDRETTPFTLNSNQWFELQNTLFAHYLKDLQRQEKVHIRHFDQWINLMNQHPVHDCNAAGICGGYLVVERDGSVYPCDFYARDELRLGKVESDSFKVMLRSDAYCAFVRESLRIHPDCATCNVRTLCRGGCRADRLDQGRRYRYCEGIRRFFDNNIQAFYALALEARQRG